MKFNNQERIKEFLSKIEKDDKKGNNINSFLQLNTNALLEAKEDDSNRRGKAPGKLAGLAVAVKANINVQGFFASCASKTLENYKSGYDATVIKKIKEQGGIIIGITNCDEFACGSSGETSAFGATKNPKALERIPGGSSSGSAAAVAAGFCDVALGSDTGGSIRNPASHCGVVGFKPTYGFVSRYGLIDLSMSLEQIGCFGSSIKDVRLLFDVIKGKDERDSTSFDIKEKEEKSSKLNNLRIGIPNLGADKEIWDLIRKRIKEVSERKKWKFQDTEVNYLDLGIQTYYPINYVEFFSATRKFDGRKYGKKIEDSCGEEVLRRILGGKEIAKAEFSGRYYHKALKAKALIKQEFENAFRKFDCLIIPTVPKLPHKFGTKLTTEEMYNYDSLTVLANLAEVPAISVPAGTINEIPVGLQIICPRFQDNKLLDIAEEFEK